MKNLALTGHRILPPDFNKNALYDALEEKLREGYNYFYCGMATGFDLLALDCLIALKQKYKLHAVACIPFEGQEKTFSPEEKELYRTLRKECDEEVVLFPSYRNGCFLARDRYMVDHADALLAYCKKTDGGSVYTVSYAKRQKKEVFLLD